MTGKLVWPSTVSNLIPFEVESKANQEVIQFSVFPAASKRTTVTHPFQVTAPILYWLAAPLVPPSAQPGSWSLAGCAVVQGSCCGLAPPPERSKGRGGWTRSLRWQGSHNRNTSAWHWPWWPSEHGLTLQHCRERKRERAIETKRERDRER